MCRAKSEGGQRCVSHAQDALEAAATKRAEAVAAWNKALAAPQTLTADDRTKVASAYAATEKQHRRRLVEYASTPQGQQVLSDPDTRPSLHLNDPEADEDATVAAIISEGVQLREHNAATFRRARASQQLLTLTRSNLLPAENVDTAQERAWARLRNREIDPASQAPGLRGCDRNTTLDWVRNGIVQAERNGDLPQHEAPALHHTLNRIEATFARDGARTGDMFALNAALTETAAKLDPTPPVPPPEPQHCHQCGRFTRGTHLCQPGQARADMQDALSDWHTARDHAETTIPDEPAPHGSPADIAAEEARAACDHAREDFTAAEGRYYSTADGQEELQQLRGRLAEGDTLDSDEEPAYPFTSSDNPQQRLRDLIDHHESSVRNHLASEGLAQCPDCGRFVRRDGEHPCPHRGPGGGARDGETEATAYSRITDARHDYTDITTDITTLMTERSGVGVRGYDQLEAQLGKSTRTARETLTHAFEQGPSEAADQLDALRGPLTEMGRNVQPGSPADEAIRTALDRIDTAVPRLRATAAAAADGTSGDSGDSKDAVTTGTVFSDLDRNERVDAMKAELSDAVQRVVQSGQVHRYLEYLSADGLNRWSWNNRVLASMQVWDRLGAKSLDDIARIPAKDVHVMSAADWKKRYGRHPAKGERAIWVLAPCTRKIREEDSDTGDVTEKVITTGFKPQAKFNVTQTTGGEPLPEPPVAPPQGGVRPGVHRGLRDRIEQTGYSYSEQAILGTDPDGAQGTLGYTDPTSKRVVVDQRLTPAQKASTMAHELAHIQCGHVDQDYSQYQQHRGQMETEAEATAYMVNRHLGLDRRDSEAFSPGYIATWSNNDAQMLNNAFSRATAAFSRITDGHWPDQD